MAIKSPEIQKSAFLCAIHVPTWILGFGQRKGENKHPCYNHYMDEANDEMRPEYDFSNTWCDTRHLHHRQVRVNRAF